MDFSPRGISPLGSIMPTPEDAERAYRRGLENLDPTLARAREINSMHLRGRVSIDVPPFRFREEAQDWIHRQLRMGNISTREAHEIDQRIRALPRERDFAVQRATYEAVMNNTCYKVSQKEYKEAIENIPKEAMIAPRPIIGFDNKYFYTACAICQSRRNCPVRQDKMPRN